MDITQDDHHTRSDLRMIQQAIENRWPTTPEMREAVLKKVADITLESEEPRTVIAGAKVVISAERQNQADDHVKVMAGQEDERTIVIQYDALPRNNNGNGRANRIEQRIQDAVDGKD